MVYEMWQKTFSERLERHGLYYGAGCVTISGKKGAKDYDYSYVPIDWADAIAKRHDWDYDTVSKKLARLNFLENVLTLDADREMVKRVNKALINMLTFRSFEIDGVETPVYTGFNFETLFALVGQRILIGPLATYKAWRKEFHKRLKEKQLRGEYINPQLREFVENGPWSSEFGILGKYFIPKHPLTGLLMWITYKRAPKEDPPKEKSERGRDGN
jgi:hypothetical protein